MRIFYCFNFSTYFRIFVKVLTERNVNISNEFNFSDVLSKCKLHLSLARTPKHSLCARPSVFLHFDKHQRNEIHSLVEPISRERKKEKRNDR